VLGNAARLAGDHVRADDGVQERGLAVIDVPQEGDDRRSATDFGFELDVDIGHRHAHPHEDSNDLHRRDAGRLGEGADGAGEFQGDFPFTRLGDILPLVLGPADQLPGTAGLALLLVAALSLLAGPAPLADVGHLGHVRLAPGAFALAAFPFAFRGGLFLLGEHARLHRRLAFFLPLDVLSQLLERRVLLARLDVADGVLRKAHDRLLRLLLLFGRGAGFRFGNAGQVTQRAGLLFGRPAGFALIALVLGIVLLPPAAHHFDFAAERRGAEAGPHRPVFILGLRCGGVLLLRLRLPVGRLCGGRIFLRLRDGRFIFRLFARANLRVFEVIDGLRLRNRGGGGGLFGLQDFLRLRTFRRDRPRPGDASPARRGSSSSEGFRKS
jgi:hypothetical protein